MGVLVRVTWFGKDTLFELSMGGGRGARGMKSEGGGGWRPPLFFLCFVTLPNGGSEGDGPGGRW